MNSLNQSYVVSFNRDRDFYQVPLALAESDTLQKLVTDLYLSHDVAKTRLASFLRLSHRSSSGISFDKVKQCPRAIWLQIVSIRLARSAVAKARIFNKIDSTLSVIAGREACLSGAGLFLYSGYALEAFKMLNNGSKKILFVYHPQGQYVEDILKRDFEDHPEVALSHNSHLGEISINEGDRVKEEILLADHIVCASSFTARSVHHVIGSCQKRVDIVPYGCNLYIDDDSNLAQKSKASVRPKVLFVGQGTQRKGLHHLIKVWSMGLYLKADLTIIVNKFDPGIAQLADKVPKKIRILTQLSTQDLSREYKDADIFVMPSLVEGFGLVYLEAMAAGCYVLGTGNTGLPDLFAPDNVASVIAAGDLNALYERLHLLIKRCASGDIDPFVIREFAASRSWKIFREKIRLLT